MTTDPIAAARALLKELEHPSHISALGYLQVTRELRVMVATLADALEAERAKVAAAFAMQDAGYSITTHSDAQAALDKLLTEARLEGWRAGRDQALAGHTCEDEGCPHYGTRHSHPGDLETLADAQAQVAAAYEAAACVTVDMGPRYDGRSVHYHIPEKVKGAVRALTPADAQAALDKLLTEARLEGWRAGRDAAANSAETVGFTEVESPLNDGLGTAVFRPVRGYDIAAIIRALPEPKEASHG